MTQDNPNQVEVQSPAAENEAPKKVEVTGETQPPEGDGRLTPEQLAARRDQIVTRVKAVGWRPFQDVALDVLGRVVAAVDGFLTGLEGGDNPRKKG